MTQMPPVDVVLIGRNEGNRLLRALQAVQGAVRQVIYVDSGSTDGSAAAANMAGAQVVDLDMSVPFTAARARNAGFAALDDPQFVQFIDGDCALDPDWIDKGRSFLDAHPDHALATGWRSEMRPQDSVYNRLCDVEWHRPAGRILTCGGDMMVRAEAFQGVGGFDPTVIAAEDDEFCTRLRKAGWLLERLPHGMTRHDAAMTTFGQWWQRAVRTGHGFAQVGFLHPSYFVRERQRAWIYGAALPAIAVTGLVVHWGFPALVCALYGLNWLRTAMGLMRERLSVAEACHQAMFLTLSKFPNLIGMLTFYRRQRRGVAMQLIEYK